MNVYEIIKKYGRFSTTIEFVHEDCYCYCVTCIIKRFRNVSVYALADSQDKALEYALELLEEVIELEKTTKIVLPEQSKQPYEGGYCTSEIGNNKELVFKRFGEVFYLGNIIKKAENGFYYVKKPYKIPEHYEFEKDLENGEQLFTWNTIQMLSGTAGEAIVKDGLVIKSKTTVVS